MASLAAALHDYNDPAAALAIRTLATSPSKFTIISAFIDY
ncbi:hypothetical protein CGSMWGv55152_01734 [Gardnerella vaginalis 55152]|uniref:Uncharacterized protein n=1 Tax=Gardnerella vaginalis 55152 TaxID=698955 RepID=I4LW06_GARVA|nr:hypothetical protein CGSMWGv55152_01734 [Gardnerella vaginalis 55152]